MSNDPILRMLGLAKKAGRLAVGEEPVGAACRARQARLVLLAADAAGNTRRRAAHFGEAGKTLWLELPFDKQTLGLPLGRSSCAMAALTDPGFAAAIVEKLAAQDPDKYAPAAQQLRQSADRALQRQREQRRHEKKLRQGKPWAPPPPRQETPAPQRGKPAPPKARRQSRQAGGGPDRPEGTARPPRQTPKPAESNTRQTSRKAGPGGRRLTGRLRHS